MNLFWRFYSVLFFTLVASSTYHLINKDSVYLIYYKTTIIFSNWYVIPYFLNILNTLITGLVCLFIVGYAFDIPTLSRLPKWFFYLRILSDCTGHAFEWKMIQSGFAQGTLGGLISLTALILPILPSYIAQFKMTFGFPLSRE